MDTEIIKKLFAMIFLGIIAWFTLHQLYIQITTTSDTARAISNKKFKYFKPDYVFIYGTKTSLVAFITLPLVALWGFVAYTTHGAHAAWIVELSFIALLIWSFWLLLASTYKLKVSFDHGEIVIPSLFFPMLYNHRVKWADITDVYIDSYNNLYYVCIKRKYRFNLKLFVRELHATNHSGLPVNSGKAFVTYVLNVLTGKNPLAAETVNLRKLGESNFHSADPASVEDAISQWIAGRLMHNGVEIRTPEDETLDYLGAYHNAKHKGITYSVGYHYYPPHAAGGKSAIAIEIRRYIDLLGQQLYRRPVIEGDSFLSLIVSIAKEAGHKFDILFEIKI